MVKKSMFRVLFAAAALSVASCATNGDIDDLKDQLTELEGQVGQLEEQQAAALAQQIALLESQILALQSELESTQGELGGAQDEALENYNSLLESLAALQTSLTDLQNDVESEAKVHYGNVTTDFEFDLVMDTGATIVTGNVMVESAEQAAKLANVTVIGGYLTVKGEGAMSVPAVEFVTGKIKFQGDVTEVVLPMLKSSGAIDIMYATSLVSVDMPELLMVDGNFMVSDVEMLTTLTMAKLDMITGNLEIDNIIPGSKDDTAFGALVTMDFSDVHVGGDVNLLNLAKDAELTSIGNIDGDLYLITTGLAKFVSNATEIKGGIYLEGNNVISELDFPALTAVGGDVYLNSNGSQVCSWIGCTTVGALTELTAFDELLTIGGNVTISNNALLERIETFNKVTAVMGDEANTSSAKIAIKTNGGNETLELINIFNELTTTKAAKGIDIQVSNTNAKWYLMFEKLPMASGILFEITATEFFKFEGFNAMETIPAGTGLIWEGASEVNAFSNAVSFNDYETAAYMIYIILPPVETSLCSMKAIFEDLKAKEATDYAGIGVFFDSDGRNTFESTDYMIATYASDCQ